MKYHVEEHGTEGVAESVSRGLYLFMVYIYEAHLRTFMYDYTREALRDTER